MKPMDKAIENVEDYLAEQKGSQATHKPILDGKLKELSKIDGTIEWHEKKIEELKEDKRVKLLRFAELLDLAMQSSHSFKNGYGVYPSNKYKINILDKKAFFGWLKEKKEPHEVLEFLTNSIKITPLKLLCEKEINDQRLNGELDPSIPGIEILEKSFTRLVTRKKEVKK